MFFTPELLAKRDSGLGLLWLAATLGSRSTFKKLPKRSVLTADITQLCDLISESAEPLALRLSSNLMFGVVRVYKVKQEIFMTDVTNCVTSLKKVVQDLHSSGAVDGQIQMANPIARTSALTIVPDPRAAYALDYDAFVANWDQYLNISGDTTRFNGSDDLMSEDDEFDPTGKTKGRTKPSSKVALPTEVLRKENHTLEEHHEHLLSASFDLSFNHSSHGIGDLSSSHTAAAFDNFFPFSDGIDLGDGLGDDLAREIGWALSPAKSVHSNKTPIGGDNRDFNFNNDEALDFDVQFNVNAADIPMDDAPFAEEFQLAGTPRPKQTSKKQAQKENNIPADARMASERSQTRAPSPATSFSRLLLSQDIDQLQPLRDITREEINIQNQNDPPRKVKRTRLLLDARTELTDDELKIARAKYVESQNRLRREMLNKRFEKDSGKFIGDLIWGVPRGIEAQGLKDFWQENFKVQVETQSGVLRIHQADGGPPPKRHKPNAAVVNEMHGQADNDFPLINDMDWGMDLGNLDIDDGMIVNDQNEGQRHSSEDPGQARRISRSASVLGASNLGFDLHRDAPNGSARSSLFPWDNAGPSSSVGDAPYRMPEGDQVVDVDVRLRGSSPGHRESPLALSRGGSPQPTGFGFSPMPTGRNSHFFGEDFAFDVENVPVLEDTQQDTQKSDLNFISLERNSFNFLEYAKMQYQTLSKPDGQLTFETVVPKSTSTRHVVAAAFYHCLVLATKNLLKLEQPEPYGSVVLDII